MPPTKMPSVGMLAKFFYDQFFTYLPYPKADRSGQTLIVTGSNVGLGLEAARHFVRLNADKVILGVRSLERGEAAKLYIEETTKRQGVVEVWQLDLGSYESTKQFVKRAEGLKRLDAVIENAGISTAIYSISEDNEKTLTTNVISTFLLGIMILPKLRETAVKFNITPHLSIVSSEVHYFTNFAEKDDPDIFKTLNSKETANMSDRFVAPENVKLGPANVSRYNVSKLLEVFYTRELATRTKKNDKPEVIINYLNPGLCHSSLVRGDDLLFIFSVLKFIIARSTEHGSRSLVHAAGAGSESHGQYLSNCLVDQ